MNKKRLGYFSSVEALCKAYKINKATFGKFKDKAGFPTKTPDGWHAESVIKFIRETSTSAAQSASEVVRLRTRKMLAEINLKELEYKKKSDSIIEFDQVRVHLSRLCAEFDRILVRTITEGSALLAGMDKVNARAFLEKWFDEERVKLKESIVEWTDTDDNNS
jgi:hypothetical protein